MLCTRGSPVSMRRLLVAVTAVAIAACSRHPTAPKPLFNLAGNWLSVGVCARTQATITQRGDSLRVLDTVDSTCIGIVAVGVNGGKIVRDSVWFGVANGKTFNGHVVNDSTIVGNEGPDTTSFHRNTP